MVTFLHLKKSLSTLIYNPVIILLGLYLREMKIYVHIETYTQIFTAAFLVLVKKGKQPKHPSTDEQINKLLCPYHGIPLSNKKEQNRASLVAQWLRVCLPTQGTRVRALVWEDPTCRGATKPVHHNY